MTDGQPPTALKLAEGLGDDEIHVWAIPYAPASGRAPLRRLLARYLGTRADAVELADGTHGRPELAGLRRNELRFNWSHSGDRALVAVARSVQPGVDLEHKRRPGARDVLVLARRFFAPREAQALAAMSADDRSQAFLRLWTVKEAVLKAHGRGLAYGLHRVVVELEGDGPALRQFDGESAAAWQVRELSLDPGWLGAIAWRGPPMRVRCCGRPD